MTAPAVTCPAWCSRRVDEHPDVDGETVHSAEVGTAEITWYPAGGSEALVLTSDERAVTAERARQLAADLIAAAGVIDGTATA